MIILSTLSKYVWYKLLNENSVNMHFHKYSNKHTHEQTNAQTEKETNLLSSITL